MRKILFILTVIATVALGATIKQNISINAFNTGELSPLMNSRSDVTQYKTGAKTLENMIVRSQGPIQRRPGTKYISEVKDSTDPVRLISFEYPPYSYIIEAGDDYFRFYRNGAQIQSGESAYEIVSPYDANDIFDVQFAQDAQYMRFAHPDYAPYKLTRSDHDSWTMTEIDFKGGPFLDENEDTDSTITTDGLTGDVNLVSTEAIFDSDHVGALWEISHNVDSNSITGLWTYTDVGEWLDDWWFIDYDGDLVIVEEGNTPYLSVPEGVEYDFTTHGSWAGTVSLRRSYDDGTTWEDVYFVTYSKDGNIQYAGREDYKDAVYMARMQNMTAGTCSWSLSTRSYINHGIVEITAVTDACNVTATVDSDYPLDSNDATYLWAEGAWSTYRGFPQTIAHHEQRCVYGGSDSYPQTVWASIIMEKNADYDNFDADDGDNDRDAWIYELPGLNPIQWMISREYLMVGTTEGVGRLGQPDKPITPTYAPTFRMQAMNGCAYIQPVAAADTVLYVERGAKKIRELTYTYTSERYVAPDMTVLAEHITGDGIVDIAFMNRPDNMLWAVRDDGQLLSFTYNRNEGVAAWARQITGE